MSPDASANPNGYDRLVEGLSAYPYGAKTSQTSETHG